MGAFQNAIYFAVEGAGGGAGDTGGGPLVFEAPVSDRARAAVAPAPHAAPRWGRSGFDLLGFVGGHSRLRERLRPTS